MRVRRIVAALAAVLTIAGTGLALAAQPAAADGTLQWPHFVKIHVQNATATTRVIIDANYAHIRWASQPGVVADDYLVRIDQSGYVHSLDNKLTFWRQTAPGGADLVVRVTEPGVAGQDAFSYSVGSMPMSPQGTSYAGPQGNSVTDTQPYVPSFRLPMDFIVNVGGVCNPATFLQVELEWTNKVWRTPDGIQPGLYRLRVQPDASVVSLDGATSFSAVNAQPWDWGHQILGVMIGGACDSVNNGGADIAGYDRHSSDGTFSHMTTWAQQPDGGYAWQPQNCGQNGACSASPRESFDAGNYIVQTKYNPNLTPHNGGGAPAPPTPAPATSPTTAKSKAAPARSAPRTSTAGPAPAPAGAAAPAPAPAAASATTAAPDTTTTAASNTATTAAPSENALSVRSKPTDHKRGGGAGPLVWVAAAVLLAAAGGGLFARRHARRS